MGTRVAPHSSPRASAARRTSGCGTRQLRLRVLSSRCTVPTTEKGSRRTAATSHSNPRANANRAWKRTR
eukprot:8312224-Lingulodinium_polyedra.AAC.1